MKLTQADPENRFSQQISRPFSSLFWTTTRPTPAPSRLAIDKKRPRIAVELKRISTTTSSSELLPIRTSPQRATTRVLDTSDLRLQRRITRCRTRRTVAASLQARILPPTLDLVFLPLLSRQPSRPSPLSPLLLDVTNLRSSPLPHPTNLPIHRQSQNRYGLRRHLRRDPSHEPTRSPSITSPNLPSANEPSSLNLPPRPPLLPFDRSLPLLPRFPSHPAYLPTRQQRLLRLFAVTILQQPPSPLPHRQHLRARNPWKSRRSGHSFPGSASAFSRRSSKEAPSLPTPSPPHLLHHPPFLLLYQLPFHRSLMSNNPRQRQSNPPALRTTRHRRLYASLPRSPSRLLADEVNRMLKRQTDRSRVQLMEDRDSAHRARRLVRATEIPKLPTFRGWCVYFPCCQTR
jgi:hypothetical protein